MMMYNRSVKQKVMCIINCLHHAIFTNTPLSGRLLTASPTALDTKSESISSDESKDQRIYHHGAFAKGAR